jgi:AcrR family transcriptional regulator
MTLATNRDLERAGKGTRQQILEAAARLFVEHGYAGTSVRDIAAELGIANPSLYYHFRSKREILVELLSEPLAIVETAVLEAQQLDGDARTRRVLAGLLASLEVHSGIAATSARLREHIPATQRARMEAMQPTLHALIAEGAVAENRELRVTMALAALNGVVMALLGAAQNGEAFVAQLRDRREAIIDIALGILR